MMSRAGRSGSAGPGVNHLPVGCESALSTPGASDIRQRYPEWCPSNSVIRTMRFLGGNVALLEALRKLCEEEGRVIVERALANCHLGDGSSRIILFGWQKSIERKVHFHNVSFGWRQEKWEND